jgi:hypothetical protein
MAKERNSAALYLKRNYYCGPRSEKKGVTPHMTFVTINNF